MKIGVIQASSRRDKNEDLYRCTCEALAHNGRGDTVINFGISADSTENYTYVETALNVSLLLASETVDFVVTGCSSGQGMMLACSSLPGVLCGYVQNPQDAFLFGRINDGNAVSLPLGLNYGWLGEINLQCTLDKLFDGEFGCGYPPQDAERKRHDTVLLKQISSITKRPAAEVYQSLDRSLLRKVWGWDAVRDEILRNGRNREIADLVQRILTEDRK